jgi:hypothetical protein
MTLTKIYTIIVIIGTILVIAIAVAAITTTSFPNVRTVFATLQTPEQAGDNATMSTTTTPPTSPLAGGGGQEQEQQTIHINKAGTNSYRLSSGDLSRASIGSFDTTYTVAGERNAIRTAENLIITTITRDFMSSPIIGYISTGTPESPRSAPLATPEQVTERITNELRRAISEAGTHQVQTQYWEIKCGFGMTLEEMRCHYFTSPGGITFLDLPTEPGGLAPTNTTNNTNTAAPISPLE